MTQKYHRMDTEMLIPRDVSCPYCGYEQDINHDDGYGREEGELHQQECERCFQIFGFYTYVSFSYETQKTPCLNDAPHDWGEWAIRDLGYLNLTKYSRSMRRQCKWCDEIEERILTDEK